MSTTDLLSAAAGTFIVGALWRRMYGGWLAFPRAALLVGAVIVFSLPAWLEWPWIKAVLLTVMIVLQFAPGVDFDRFWSCLGRYSLPMLAFAVLSLDPFPLIVGPVIALVYYLGRRDAEQGRPWVLHWPWDTAEQEMTNGYTTFGELTVGGLSALAFVMMPLVQP